MPKLSAPPTDPSLDHQRDIEALARIVNEKALAVTGAEQRWEEKMTELRTLAALRGINEAGKHLPRALRDLAVELDETRLEWDRLMTEHYAARRALERLRGDDGEGHD
jgi:hypothetical protein